MQSESVFSTARRTLCGRSNKDTVMSQIYVKAAPGLKLPREENPRKYIDENDAVQVEGTHYYLKAVIDGDLIKLDEKEVAALSAAKPAPSAKPTKPDGE